tara:strand:+ start:281 stop:511 length:231 start_codon:yes stop_codon:yes gene_type:complete
MAETFTNTGRNTMLVKLNKEEKKIIGTLVKAGSDVHCCGDGWVLDGEVFESYKDFIAFCKVRTNAIKLIKEMEETF